MVKAKKNKTSFAKVVCKDCLRKFYIAAETVKAWSNCPGCKKNPIGKGTDGNKVGDTSKPVL